MRPTTPEQLISHVTAHTGANEGDAQRAIVATLHALGARLPASCAEVIAHGLPARYAEALRDAPNPGDFDLHAMYERVADDLDIPLPRAVEQVTAVCAALSERVDQEALSHLQRHLPEEMLALFRVPQHAAPTAPPHTIGEAPWRTIATARPRSRRPVSEAPDRPHRDTVMDDNPKAPRKLSSGKRSFDD